MTVDAATWQQVPYSAYYYLYAHHPAVVFQARVNMASVDYPVNQVTYDSVTTGAYTDLKAEMLLLLGTTLGGDQLGRQRIHADSSGIVATSSSINIGRSSRGIDDGSLDIQDSAYLTVLDLRPIWAAPPYIDVTTDPDNPVTYKDGVWPFDYGYCFSPVVNLGVDRLEIVDTPADTVDLTFTVVAYPTHPDLPASISLLWDIADGTLISGTLTSATITVRYGVTDHDRYIACTATDSYANSQTGWRLVAVKDKNHADLVTKFQIVRHRQAIDGQEVQVRLDSPLPYATYPDGTEMILGQRERYNTTVTNLVGYTGAENIVAAGWLQSEQSTGDATRRGFIGRSTLTIADAAARLKSLPGFPQVVERETLPTVWNQMENANMDRYYYYLLKWHSNVLTRADFTWTGTGETYAFTTLGSDGQSLYQQVDTRAQAIGYRFTCNKNGQLAVVADPQVQPTIGQAADYGLPYTRTSTVQIPITEADWMNYRYTYLRPPRVHWDRGEAIVSTAQDAADLTDIPTAFVVAPGLAPGQGLSSQVNGNQLVVSLDELAIREGNRLKARMNARLGNLEVDIRPGDAIDPALLTWVQFTITSATAGVRGRTWNSARFLPLELNHSYDPKKWLRKTTITLEEEVAGTPGVLDPQYTVSEVPSLPGPPTVPSPLEPALPLPPWDGSAPVKATTASPLGAYFARANRFSQATGTIDDWTDLSSGLTGTIYSYCSNPFNYKEVFAGTSAGIENLTDQSANTPAWSVVQPLSALGGSPRYPVKMIGTIRNDGMFVCLLDNGDYAITFDAWASMTLVTGNQFADIVFCEGNTTALLYATTSTIGDGVAYYHVYRYQSTDGLTWTLVKDQYPLDNTTFWQMTVPYTKPGGAINRYSSSMWTAILIQNDFYHVSYVALDDTAGVDAGSVRVVGDNIPNELNSIRLSITKRSLAQFTHDSAYAFYLGRANSFGAVNLIYTDDNFVSRSVAVANFGNGTEGYSSVTGWPGSPLYALAAISDNSNFGGLRVCHAVSGIVASGAPPFFPGYSGGVAPCGASELSIWPLHGLVPGV